MISVERGLWTLAVVLVAILAFDNHVEAAEAEAKISVLEQQKSTCMTMDRMDKLLDSCELVSQTNAKCINLHKYVRDRFMEMKDDDHKVRGSPVRAHERSARLRVDQAIGGSRAKLSPR